ncbi:hypothetical protein [Chromobacterium subtsugae]|uniref:hypothetical protein n=1 Tax=Chromobacterium subtsugae TaxID=251747 RepID=UPI000640E98E|nr:hypothetical protein [Chromobacterium subtsugae]OBU87418.1 hypothetical protein MY55_04430 [Chromobacterium subtsugae]
MTRIKLAAAAALSSLALLTGCATPLAGKPADEATRKVIAQNWQNASYNFDGQLGFTQLRFIDSEGKLSQPDIADTVDQVGRSIKMNISGAIDAPTGRLELTPELRFERRNLLASVKVPLQFHAQDMSLLVDPSAIDLALPSLRKNPGKFIRAKLPADIAAKIPLKEMYQAMPQILDQAYAQVDKKAFSFEPLDAYADEVGAKYKLRLTLSKEQEQKMTLQILDGLAKAAHQQAAQPDDKFNAESMLTLVRDLVKLSPAGEMNGQTVSDIYVSRGGELEAIRQTIHMTSAEFSADAYFNLRYSHHGKPQFVYQPAESDIIDYDKLELPDWLKSKAGADEAPAADAALPAPAYPQPAAPAAKAKKRKAKPRAQ